MLTELIESRSLRYPEKWLLRMLGGPGTATGVHVNEETALSWSAFSAGVRLLSKTIALLPLNIYQRRPDGGKDPRPDHPLYPVVHDQPNHEMTSFEWREMSMAHLIGWNNVLSEIVRNNRGNVTELWPINPDRVQMERNKRGSLSYRITLPGVEPGTTTGFVRLLPDEVLHIRGFSQGALWPRGLIETHREAIGLGLATEEFAARFFGSGAMPSGVFEYPAGLSEMAFERLKESLKKEHEGLSNAHRIMLLEEGMKWQQMTVDPEKAQFLGIRRFQVSEAARILEIPPHMLGDLERATFSNIEHQGIEFVTYSILAWARRWEQRLNMSLLGRKDRQRIFFEFLLEGLLRGDSDARANFYNSLFQMGAMSPNEIRAKENMNPYPGGDIRVIQQNMAAIQADGGVIPLNTEQQSNALRE